MKDALDGKTVKEFVETYSYLKDNDDEDKKST